MTAGILNLFRRRGTPTGLIANSVLFLLIFFITSACGEMQSLMEGDQDAPPPQEQETTQSGETTGEGLPVPYIPDPTAPEGDTPPDSSVPALMGSGVYTIRGDYIDGGYQTCWYLINNDTGQTWHPVNMPARSESFDYISDYSIFGFTYIPHEGEAGCIRGEHIELTDIWDETPPPTVYQMIGPLEFIEVEGGCWNIGPYNITNLPLEYHVDGLWVEISYTVSVHQISICMTGMLIDLVSIKPYQSGDEPAPPPPPPPGW